MSLYEEGPSFPPRGDKESNRNKFDHYTAQQTSYSLMLGWGSVMMGLRTVALALSALSIAFSSANGADLPAEPFPVSAQTPVVYNPVGADPWTGFYFGGDIGYGWANANSNVTLAGNALVNGALVGNGANLDGVNGGLQAGYNWQTGNFLLGVESDIQASDQNQTSNFICGPACSVSEAAKIDWFGTIRGRAGFVYKDVLVYGTSGVNWTRGENSINGTLNGVSANLANFTHESVGWVAGAGVEWMFYWGFSAKIEYLFLKNRGNNSTIALPPSVAAGTLTDTAMASNSVVRLGLNYHFPAYGGWPAR